MLAVAPQQFQLPRDQISMDSAPTLQMTESEPIMKQEVKKSMFSPYKVLLALAVFFMLAMVSFKLYNEFIVTPTESQINSTHGKIIQNADTSSKDKASNSGSSSSKTSKNNDKPNMSSLPASKTPISSNSNLSGSDSSSSSGSGGSDDEQDKDGQKKKKYFDSNKSSDTKSSKFGATTDDDDEDDVEQEEEQQFGNQLLWPQQVQTETPIIGSSRP